MLIIDDCELMRRLIKTLIGGVADAIVECASGYWNKQRPVR